MTGSFRSPPDPSIFNSRVWEIVRQIPSGQVATYGQIAALIPPPQGISLQDFKAFSPRWVGSAMARCPNDVPWQRVINAQGKISARNETVEQAQRALLEAEGVELDARGKIDLHKYGWKGPEK